VSLQVPSNEKAWRAWFEKDAPEEEVIPDGYHVLDTFRKLLIIRCVRIVSLQRKQGAMLTSARVFFRAFLPDRTLAQSRKYVASSLGQRFAEPIILNLEAMLEESRPLTPMICFLSMGSDPSPGIINLAKRRETSCRAISMGQGQEIHARKLIATSMEEVCTPDPRKKAVTPISGL